MEGFIIIFFPKYSMHIWIFLIFDQISSLNVNTFNLFSSFPPLKVQFKSHYFFEAFFFSAIEEVIYFLPPLISLSTYELFGDWHLLTCIVILMCISKAQYFDVERGIKVHLVHQTSEVEFSSESFQPTCQINFAWTAPLTDSLVSFDYVYHTSWHLEEKVLL
jgi:hypothetical protein